MPEPNALSRSQTPLEQDTTLVAVVELSLASWLAAGIIPGVERQPLKRLEPDPEVLLRLLERWRGEAAKAGRTVARVAVAYEAGRDGFWLARWLRARGVEAHVIHPTSVAVSREHRRAKTDRLDTELLKRAFLGWLRGERGHCGMAAVPTLEQEDAKRPTREHEALVGERTRIVNRIKAALVRLGVRGFEPTRRGAPECLRALRTPEGVGLPPNTLAELLRDVTRLGLVRQQIGEVEEARAERLREAPGEGTNATVRLLARVAGVGVETADMLAKRCSRATCATGRRWRGTRASPARRTRAGRAGASRAWPRRATRGCVGA
jgi:transposase